MPRTITAPEFESLYRETAPQLFGYLRRRGAADAEDLVADTFAIAWRRRSQLPDPGLRRAWLFGTARRLLLADSRTRARQHRAVEDHALTSVPGVAAQPSPEDADAQRRQAVAAALARLSPSQRELIRLVEWEGLTTAELAVAFGIRAATARVRLHRARRSLAADPTLVALQAGDSSPVAGSAAGRR